MKSAAQRLAWNELVQGEHPCGAACKVGAQLRYLLLSDYGILGALADRERFIGWDPDLRQHQLYRPANLSRSPSALLSAAAFWPPRPSLCASDASRTTSRPTTATPPARRDVLTSLEGSGERGADRLPEWCRLWCPIDDWHRVRKSGCKVTGRGLRRGERIERAVTIKAVIAWRLTVMTLLGLDTPGLPPGTLLSKLEIAALEDFATASGLPPPDNLGRAGRTTAQLGGYLNRKHDPVPGHQIVWQGYTRLATVAQS